MKQRTETTPTQRARKRNKWKTRWLNLRMGLISTALITYALISISLLFCSASPALGANGGEIHSGETKSGDIAIEGQTDSYTFYGNAGQGVVVEMSTANSSLGTAIYLYRPDGTLGTKAVGGMTATRVRIEDHQLEQTGTYTIVTTASQAFDTSKTGAYGLSLVLTPGATSSQQDPDGGNIGYLRLRNGQSAEMRQYKQQLAQWEKEGYDVSEFTRKWFK